MSHARPQTPWLAVVSKGHTLPETEVAQAKIRLETIMTRICSALTAIG
jgi:hypothetical protein